MFQSEIWGKLADFFWEKPYVWMPPVFVLAILFSIVIPSSKTIAQDKQVNRETCIAYALEQGYQTRVCTGKSPTGQVVTYCYMAKVSENFLSKSAWFEQVGCVPDEFSPR